MISSKLIAEKAKLTNHKSIISNSLNKILPTDNAITKTFGE